MSQLVFVHDRAGYTGPLRATVRSEAAHGALGAAGLGPASYPQEWVLEANGNLPSTAQIAGVAPGGGPMPPLHRLTVYQGARPISSVTFYPIETAPGIVSVLTLLQAGQAQVAAPEHLAALSTMLDDGTVKLAEMDQALADTAQSRADNQAQVREAARAHGFKDTLTSALNTTVSKVYGGTALLPTLTGTADGLQVTGGYLSHLYAIDRGYVSRTGVNEVTLTARLDALNADNPAFGLAFGTPGAATRRALWWRNNGQVYAERDDSNVMYLAQNATPAYAYTAGDTVSMRVTHDTRTSSATLTLTLPSGSTVSFQLTGNVPAGSVYLVTRGQGGWTFTGLQMQGAPNALGDLLTRDYRQSELIGANLFPDPRLTGLGGKILVGTPPTFGTSGGHRTLALTGPVGDKARWAYDLPADGPLAPASRLSVQAQVTVTGGSTTTAGGASLVLIFLDAAGTELSGTRLTTANTVRPGSAGTLTLEGATIPASTATVRVGLDSDGTGNTSAIVSTFSRLLVTPSPRLPVLALPAPIDLRPPASAVFPRLVYVSVTGNDANDGLSTAKPFATLNKALAAIGGDGTVELAGGDYRQQVNTGLVTGHVTLRSAKNARVRLLGSDKLTVTKTAGYTSVYQAPLAAALTPAALENTPATHGPRILFDGVPGGVVAETDRHPLQRGQTSRLDFAWGLAAPNLADVDVVTPAGSRAGKYWHDTAAGVIYMSAPGGASLTAAGVSVENYARYTWTTGSGNGHLTLIGIESAYSKGPAFDFSGLKGVTRSECRAMGSRETGYQDDELLHLRSERCEAGGNALDGENGHMKAGFAGTPLRSGGATGVYVDSWSHDNGDDGHSFHERGTVTMHGGLYEFNYDRGVVASNGAHYTIAHATTQGNGYLNAESVTRGEGLSVVDVANDGGDGTTVLAVGVVSRGNLINYRSGGHARNLLELRRCVSENPVTASFQADGGAALLLRDCGSSGDAGKQKVTATGGIITVLNTALVT